MKTVLLMRHAKSSWKKKRLRDHERGLSQRGKRDATRMGALLAELELVPQFIASSTAKRARKTAQKVARAAGCLETMVLVDELYPGDDDAYWHLLSHMDERLERVLVVGHDPAIAEFLTALTGELERLPTGTVARISLPIHTWRELEAGVAGELVALWRPKELAERA